MGVGIPLEMDVLVFLGAHNVLDLLEDYARKRPDELLHIIKRGFDDPGSHEALRPGQGPSKEPI